MCSIYENIKQTNVTSWRESKQTTNEVINKTNVRKPRYIFIQALFHVCLHAYVTVWYRALDYIFIDKESVNVGWKSANALGGNFCSNGTALYVQRRVNRDAAHSALLADVFYSGIIFIMNQNPYRGPNWNY